MLNLPTDNLYKLSALSGLIILFFSMYYPAAKILDISLEMADIEARIEFLKINRESNYLYIDSLDVNKEIYLIGKQINHNLLKTEFIRKYHLMSLFGCIFGIIISFWGFLKWYKIQKVQDLILEKQLESMKDKLS